MIGTFSGAAFTLIELLAVVAVIGLLTALLAPVLGRTFRSGQEAQCRSNLRQLHLANETYSTDRGRYVAGASDLFDRNLHRWHGTRTDSSAPFSPAEGPLANYLGRDGRVKLCPAFAASGQGFEAGCGGYGYNEVGVGSRSYALGFNPSGVAEGARSADISDAGGTVMFTDAAYPQRGAGGSTVMIEYSFAEAYHQLSDGTPVAETGVADPTIHFRHENRATVAWVDGHVSAEPMSVEAGKTFTRNKLGWFGGHDNALFDTE